MPEVTRTVGRFEILRDVGRGGMAIVYLARQIDLDRFVALKELGAFHASDPSFAQRFLRESRLAGSLSHPNIVTVFDYFEHDGTPYIAMEYIERGSMRPYVGHMTLAQIGGVLEGLLAGLAHGEEHAIVHRDLKPENLMVTAEGRVKIADFGIAKATNQMQTGAFLTATGTTVGTPTYMAPEQAMAQDIGPWTDLYSVGCMAFEMFVGRVPFHDSEAPMAILLRHVNEPIPPARSVNPEVDQAISDWIEELLVKDPAKRTRSANDAWDAFEEIMIGLLGPRWRREARMSERQQGGAAKPLTPAPFQGTSAEDVASDEFESFAWHALADTPPPDDAVPGPYTPPPDEAVPGPHTLPPDDAVPGPYTPPPDEAVPGPHTLPPDDAVPGPYTPPDAPEDLSSTSGDFVTVDPAREVTGEEVAVEAPAEQAEAPPPPAASTDEALVPVRPAGPPPEPAGAAPSGPVSSSDVPADASESEGYTTFDPPASARPPVGPLDDPLLERRTPPDASGPPSGAPLPATPPAVATTLAPAPRVSTRLSSVLIRAGPGPRRRVRGSAAVAALVSFPVLALIGYLVAPHRVTTVPVRANQHISGRGFGFGTPTGWRASTIGRDLEIPGLDLAGGLAARPPNAPGEGILFGLSSSTEPSLLPRALADQGTRPEPVRLPAGTAYRYAGLHPGGSGVPVTIYAISTSAGVATLACRGARGRGVEEACDSAARTLRLSGSRVYSPPPRNLYARGLNAAVSRLLRGEGGMRAPLRDARTAGGLARRLKRLAGFYAAAAKAVSAIDVAPFEVGPTRRIEAQLTGLEDRDRALSRAAQADERARYTRLKRLAERGRADLGSQLEQLRSLGYRLTTRGER